MKKKSKILSLIIAIIVLCVSFSGCISVKDMREQQAYFSGNDIVCDGITYKMLSNVPEGVYPSGDIQELYLTKKDVPTLLSQIFVDDNFTYGITKDKNFITVVNTNTLYCREDMFDDIQSKIDNNEILYTNDYSFDRWIEGKFLSTPISTDIIKTIEQVISTGKEIKSLNRIALEYDEALGITANLHGNLKKDMYHLHIYKAKNGVYLEYNKEGRVNSKYYKIPENKVNTFIELIEKIKVNSGDVVAY